jgi:hypothetical protein
MLAENQDVYEGEWLNGKREGSGIFYYKSKEKIYDGACSAAVLCLLCCVLARNASQSLLDLTQTVLVFPGEWVNDIPKCGVYVDASEFFEECESLICFSCSSLGVDSM